MECTNNIKGDFMLIDTTNRIELNKYEQKRMELSELIQNRQHFTIDDFVLIRTTNFLEEDHVLKAICKVPFVTHINNSANKAMFDILYDKTNVNLYDEEQRDEFLAEVRKYTPLSSQYRSTIHFTLNGLVSNHSMGTFDNRNFIIVDKLNQHLGVETFSSIRMEDTFVSGEFKLSDEAIILINENKISVLMEQYPWLTTYNVILFRGDEKLATEMLLISMGIMPENIGAHSAEYSKRTPMYENFFSDVTKNYGISQTKHINSPEYQKDDEKNLVLWQIYDKNFYDALFSTFYVDTEQREFLLSSKGDIFQQGDVLKDVILKIGLEKYQKFVLEYNERIMFFIKSGKLPANDEILLANSITIDNQIKICK